MGFYKSTCVEHAKNREFFGKTRHELIAKSLANLRQFQARVPSCRIVCLDQCCIKKQLRAEMNSYTSSIRVDQLMKMYENEERSYYPDKYSPMNYQQSILSPLVDCYHRIAMVKEASSYFMRQYDMKSAYISSLKNKKLLFPLGRPVPLYGDHAMQFVVQNYDKPLFYVAKCIVLVDKGVVDNPFLPILVRQSQSKRFCSSNIIASTNATCRTCSFLFLKKHRKHNLKKCTHSDSQRSFSAILMKSDLQYALEMGYSVRIHHLDFFPNAAPIPSFHCLANVYEHLRTNKKKISLFARKFVKQLVLSGFGKFAQKPSKPRSIKTLSSIAALQNEFQGIQRIHHLDEATITVATEYKSTYRKSCNPLVFAVASNSTRQLLHKCMGKCEQMGMLVSRLNCDSLIVCCSDKQKPQLELMLHQLDMDRSWLLEHDNIVGHIHHKKRSTVTYTSEGSFQKVCGLHLRRRYRDVPTLDTSIVHTNNFFLGEHTTETT